MPSNLAVVAFVVLLPTLLFAEQWNTQNDPNNFSSKFVYTLKQLNTQGKLARAPWSDTYWPSFQSGIANRWNSDNPQNFHYKTYSKEELHAMTSAQLKELSPAEKFDIFNGRYDYPTVKSEWKRTSPQDPQWEGLCHGWAPSSLSYKEPNPVTVANSDGIQVPFGSSDIKALLTYFVAEYDDRGSETQFVSERCQYDLKQNPKYEEASPCKDMNAGTLHVLLSNQLGSMNSGFVVDRDRSIQVWNQPLYSYSSQVISSESKSVQVKTQMTYGKETSPSWTAHAPKLVTEEYIYILDIDTQGNIVGGTHKTWERPDFGWMTKVGEFRDYFSTLKEIYQKSIQGSSNLTEDVLTLNTKPLPRPHTIGIHAVLTGFSGEFGTDPLKNYSNNYRESWTLHAENPTYGLMIHFQKFSTQKIWDRVRIYEGAEGQGALIAVIHGEKREPFDILVNGPAAYVVFTSDSSVNDSGFQAIYTSVNFEYSKGR